MTITATTCSHRRVRPHGTPRLVSGPAPFEDVSPQRHGRGHHVTHSGTCLDCGWPVLRTSPSVALGPWERVANGSPPAPRRRRADERYGSGRDRGP